MAATAVDPEPNDLRAYLAFAAANPALFVNDPNGGIEVLLDAEAIRAVEAEVTARLAAAGLPAAWARVGIAYEDQYGRVVRDAVRFPDGRLGTYIRYVDEAGAPPGVVVLPLWQGRVLLVRQFRHATRAWHLETPRGYGQRGEPSADGARRELAEEIGGEATRLVALGPIYPNTGLDGGHAELFYAEVARYGEGEIGEAIAAILPVTIAELERLIADGTVSDGYTIGAFARARLRGLV